MPTLDSLVDETLGMFTSYTGVVEQACELAADIGVSDGTATLGDPGMVGRGLYEIGEELIYASAGDVPSGIITIPSFGRGQQGSTVTEHIAGSKVVRAPRVPRARAKNLLNQGIAALYPDLFAVRVSEGANVSLTQWGYEIPAALEDVLSVQYRTPPFGNWIGVREWRLDHLANTTDFPSGKSLAIGREMWTGAPLKITYTTRPSPLVNPTDDWALTTGLPDSAADLAVLWAAERLVAGDELLRTQTRSVEQSQRGLISPAGAAANASRLMHQQFTERLTIERRALMARYGLPRIVRSWT